jgi:threonylcarbamoyladenosine tRNA methylthiotransferase MtaB
MKKLMKIKSYALGCKISQYEAERFSIEISRKRNIEKIHFNSKEKADFVLINTCAVTETAVSKSLKILKKALKENPEAKIYVLGCATRIYPEKFKDLAGINNLKIAEVSHQNTKQILQEAERYFFGNIEKEKINQNSRKIFCRSKSRYFLKIQDGCNRFCSYCIIPYARPRLMSRCPNELIEEIKEAERAGFEEIILSGIHIGMYGWGENKREKDLVSLLQKILRETQNCRIRLSSIEINEINSDLIRLLGQSDRICPHLHIPLQSGSDKILKSMNRPYGKNYFKRKIKKIQKEVPEICLTTDAIVGFPGETERDFQETFDFCRKINFAKIHVFSYSEHSGTKAASIKPKVDSQAKKERSVKLRKLSEKLREKEIQKNKNKKFEVVVERFLSGNKFSGKNAQGFNVVDNLDNVSKTKSDIKRGAKINFLPTKSTVIK